MASSNSHINKPQRGCPKRAELPDVNINTGAQSINTKKASLSFGNQRFYVGCQWVKRVLKTSSGEITVVRT